MFKDCHHKPFTWKTGTGVQAIGWNMGQQKFSIKGKTLNIKGHTISVTTTQLHSYSMKIAIDNT